MLIDYLNVIIFTILTGFSYGYTAGPAPTEPADGAAPTGPKGGSAP